jgi:hypothetical protein
MFKRKAKTRNRPEDLPGEIWKTVVGYKGLYEVSNMGRVYSTLRMVMGPFVPRLCGGMLLKPGLVSHGYFAVVLNKEGTATNCRVHRLVAECFCEGQTGPYVRHLNGIKTDNRAENLSWGTQKDNMADARGHGTISCGENRANAKMTEELVRQLRAEYVPWVVSESFLCKKYGIKKSTLHQALVGTTWAHVK